MKKERKRVKKKSSILFSVFLAAVMLAGSLPSAFYTVEAEESSTEEYQTKIFRHTGMIHTEEGFDKIRENIEKGTEPNLDTWNQLKNDGFSDSDWNPRPVEKLVRGGEGSNYGGFFVDIRRAYQNALIWKIDRSQEHGKAACRILNAWSEMLKTVTGNSDRFLASGIYGYTLANAAELMRDHPEFNQEAMENLLLNVFYPMNEEFLQRHNGAHIGNYWANWDLCNIAAMISIGVFCDREDIYQQAVNYYKTGTGNGSIYNAMPYVYQNGVVQWQEAGRDQGHTTLGISLCEVICETAWNQGDDLYGLSDNRLLKAAEYVAGYNNLKMDMPYSPYEWKKGQSGSSNWMNVLSDAARGSSRPVYSMIYNHYVNRKGLRMDTLKKVLQPAQGEYIIEGPSGNGDELGWQTLTFANLSARTEDSFIQGDFTDGIYRIRSVLTGKSLADTDGGLRTVDKGFSDAEWWNLKNKGDGEYIVTNTVTGNVMEVSSDDNAQSDSEYYSYDTLIGTGTADGSLKQNFAFVKNDSGDYRIIPTINYLVLSLQDSAKEDTSIQQKRNNSGADQKWVIEKISDTEMNFTFDNDSAGFTSDYTTAENSGGVLTEHDGGKALLLDGTDDFLKINTRQGQNPLTAAEAFTVSAEIKPDSTGKGNWIFYAGAEGIGEGSSYLAMKEESGIITYYYNGTEVLTAQTTADSWYHVSLVQTAREAALYVNGEEKARKKTDCSLSQILNQDSVFQIGRGNLGNGEFYKGLIDNLRIAGRELSHGEVIVQAADYANPVVPEVLVDFDFEGETGLIGGAAAADGRYSLKEHDGGTALYLNGFQDFLKVTGKEGGTLLPGGQVKELTISLQAKQEGGTGWVFYAAPNEYTQKVNLEQYIGVADQGKKILAERYKNQGTRSPSASGNIQGDRWHYMTVVLTESEIIVYDNGEEKARKVNYTPLSEILGGDSVWYIGKANWGYGEFFQGLIDNYKVLSRAWTPEEVRAEALKYVDRTELQAAIENAEAREESQYDSKRWANYSAALENANRILRDSQALQSSIDSVAEALNLVQSWMRLDEALNDSVDASREGEYTSMSWKPYKAALQTAREVQENETADRNLLTETAKTLRETQKALCNKNELIMEVMSKIDAIGQVQQTPECSRKIILARKSCGMLSKEELNEITNLSVLEAAEQAMTDYLAEFTFDDEETGFIGGQAIAEGRYEIENGALYLNGSADHWLKAAKSNGEPLLTGITELTVSVGVKPQTGGTNWVYYAAMDENSQTVNQETYLGLLENNGTYMAERYKNTGSRPKSASAKAENDKWHYMTLVYTPTETIFYLDGTEVSREASSIALTDILGERSIFQIGKANWGEGEYFKGYIDQLKVLGTAMTAKDIKAEADCYLEKKAKALVAEFTFDDADNGLKGAGAMAQPNGTPVFVQDDSRGKVLSLDGTGSVWLNVTGENGSPVLGDAKEMTVSYYSKAGRAEDNWVFYAAKDGKIQEAGSESFVGIKEKDGKVSALRFCQGKYSEGQAAYQTGWNHVTVVYGIDNTKIYLNGMLAGTSENSMPLTDIIDSGSMLLIGRANVGREGEFYQGLLDDFRIYNYALSEEEIREMEPPAESDTDKKVLVEKLEIVPAVGSKSLTAGERFTFEVKVSPENASNKNVELSSSNPGAVKISGTTIIGAGAGEAVITAKAADGSGVKTSLRVSVCLNSVTTVKAQQQSSKKYVKVSFGRVNGAKSYDIYRSVKAGSGYQKIGSSRGSSYVDKKVKAAKTYYYKIKAKAAYAGYDSALSSKSAKVKVLAVPVVKVKAEKGRKLIVSWKKVQGAKGYVIYTSAKKTKGFKRVKILKKAKSEAIIKAAKKTGKLYVKVRPFYLEKRNRVYGTYSKAVSVKLKQ